MSDDTCTPREAAALLGVSRSRVRALLAGGTLESTRDGRRYRVTRRSVYRRLAASDVPQGVSSLLSYLRFLRDLTAEPSGAAFGTWRAALRDHARELFSHPAGRPYRGKLHALALAMLETAKAGDWRRLDEERAELYLLWTEYDFVAAPLEPQARATRERANRFVRGQALNGRAPK